MSKGEGTMSDLISRSRILKIMEMWMKVSSYNESERNIMRALYYEVRTAPSAQQWVPVTERLPKEEKKTYWVCTDAGTQCECRWTHLWWESETTGWHWHIWDIPYGEKVIAWMELPEPYEGGDA